MDVATSSYHENGTVKFLEVAAGHIVLEENSKVKSVHFTATGEGESAKFQNAEGKTISIDLSKVNAEEISFSRDAVTIEENGTYVAEVTTESTEYIWLFGNGIKEQMVVTDTTDPIAENGTLKAVIEAGAEDGSVAEQIANPAKRNDGSELLDANDQVITDPEQAVVEELPTKEDIKAVATLFAGGKGTESNPYLIDTYDGLVSLDLTGSTKNDLFFKLIADINVKDFDTDSWCHTDFYNDPAYYHINLNNHKITIGSKYLYGYAVNLELYNGTIDFDGVDRCSVVGYGCYQDFSSYNMNFHDLVLTGEVETSSSHYGPLVSYAFGINSGNSSINASNIVNNMTINNKNSTGYSGGLFGYVQGSAVSSSVSNCTFNGKIVSAYAGAFLNPCSAPKAGMTSSNNALNGQLLASIQAIPFGCNANLTGGSSAYNALQDTVTIGESSVITTITAATDLITINENNEVVLNRVSGVETYRVAVVFSVNSDDNGTGGYPRFITVDLPQFDGESVNTGIFRYAIHQENSDLSAGKTVVTKQSGTIIWIENDGYHVYQEGYSLSNNKARICAYGYAGGNIITYQEIPYSY